ncbi:hypothetical protein N0K08_11950 [Acidovorax sp. Be4]|uniref:HNH endonuclease n=1 Tax=Acidovorax bellezanensis TaxID=2976702 RepID=A0ABT2PQ02_9BURK|nr:hypothetical protein [Acidovorax sp. Be4]MCT9811352.1 hypothetical protein [Acidovorax sp. Be4]
MDHHLPKEVFPQFSLYSLNLVPACHRCNHAKGENYQGGVLGQRGVHPYFDDFVGGRALTARFEPPWNAPKVSIIPFNVTGDALLAVQWQIENVILRAGIENTLRGLWGQLVVNPRKSLRLKQGLTDVATVQALFIELAGWAAHMQMSENDWQAVFYHGVANSPGADAYVVSLL